jgi:hypothetical protein
VFLYEDRDISRRYPESENILYVHKDRLPTCKQVKYKQGSETGTQFCRQHRNELKKANLVVPDTTSTPVRT